MPDVIPPGPTDCSLVFKVSEQRSPPPCVDVSDHGSHSPTPEVTVAKDGARMGRPSELSGGLGELAEAMGGIEALARACGVTARTIQRWDTGERNPTQPARLVLEMLARRHRVKSPFAPRDVPDTVLRAGERALLALVARAPRGRIGRSALVAKLARKMPSLEEGTTFVTYLGTVARAELVERFDVDGDREEIRITKKGRAFLRRLK